MPTTQLHPMFLNEKPRILVALPPPVRTAELALGGLVLRRREDRATSYPPPVTWEREGVVGSGLRWLFTSSSSADPNSDPMILFSSPW